MTAYWRTEETRGQQLAGLIRGDHTGAERWLPAERSLAIKLGVSRTVVREATKRLEQQGLLEVQHGTGIRVVDKLHRPLNGSLELLIPDIAESLQQLNETRLSIEPDAARQAIHRHILAAGENMDLPSLKARKSK